MLLYKFHYCTSLCKAGRHAFRASTSAFHPSEAGSSLNSASLHEVVNTRETYCTYTKAASKSHGAFPRLWARGTAQASGDADYLRFTFRFTVVLVQHECTYHLMVLFFIFMANVRSGVLGRDR